MFQDSTRTNARILAVSLRYVEIYNEALFDLLNPSATSASVTLVEAKDVIIPHGATEMVLQDEQHALESFFRGEASRVPDALLPCCLRKLKSSLTQLTCLRQCRSHGSMH